MSVRWFLALVALVTIQAAVVWVRQGREPEGFGKLRPLNQFPARLGDWTGKDEPMDPRLFEAIRAEATVNRVYQEETGSRLAIQVAAFAGNETTLPHRPQGCYTKAGWSIADQKEVPIRVADQPPRPAQLLAFEQEGQRIHVLYWYQFGEAHVLDYDGLRRERWKLFGQRIWPPLVKVMIQTGIGDSYQAEAQLREFGELVLAWTKDIQEPLPATAAR